MVANWAVAWLIWPTVEPISLVTEVDAPAIAAAVDWKLSAREPAATMKLCLALELDGAALQADASPRKAVRAAGIPDPGATGIAFWTGVRALNWAPASPCAPDCCQTSLSESRSRLSTSGPWLTPPPRPWAGSKASA